MTKRITANQWCYSRGLGPVNGTCDACGKECAAGYSLCTRLTCVRKRQRARKLKHPKHPNLLCSDPNHICAALHKDDCECAECWAEADAQEMKRRRADDRLLTR